ncbi:MAG: hypothetical protein FWD06_03415 [Oscillospiraceae bacterium]|nr:hypothetical protein [Oscillospiraceae bacterium]
MKKLLSLLLVLALLFGVGGVSAAAQEPLLFDEPVVLGQPLLVHSLDTVGLFAWTVEESGYFLFSWNSGNIGAQVFEAQSGHSVFFEFVNEANPVHRGFFAVGEYSIWIEPRQFSGFEEHSMTITEIESVVLGEPLVVSTLNVELNVGMYRFAVEESGDFLFTWNSGDFLVAVFEAESEDSVYFGRINANRTNYFDAGEYILEIRPWRASELVTHSVTITATNPPSSLEILLEALGRLWQTLGRLGQAIVSLALSLLRLFWPLLLGFDL